MTRTYMRNKPSGSSVSSLSRLNVASGSSVNVRQGSKSSNNIWSARECKNIFDDSLDSPTPAPRTKNPLAGTHRTFFDSCSESSEASTDTKERRNIFEDSFDTFCKDVGKLKVKDKKENVDPFDMLLESSSRNETSRPKNQKKVLAEVDIWGSPPGTPNTPPERKTKSKVECQLFSSFTQADEELQKPLKVKTSNNLLKRPSSYRGRTKKPSSSSTVRLKPKTKAAPVGHNSTLDVELRYVKQSEEKTNKWLPEPSPLRVPSVNSRLQLTPSSSFCKVKLRVASTPIIANKSSVDSLALVGSPGEPLVDSVFISGVKPSNPEFSDAKSTVSSLSNLDPIHVLDDKTSPSRLEASEAEQEADDYDSVQTDEVESFNEAPDEEVAYEEEEEDVYLNCVCEQPNEPNDDFTILCSDCGTGFHLGCVNFSEEDIHELEQTHMSWSCPRCISKAGQSQDQDSVEELSSSGPEERVVPVVEEIPSFFEVSHDKSKESINIDEQLSDSEADIVEEHVTSIADEERSVVILDFTKNDIIATSDVSQSVETLPEPAPSSSDDLSVTALEAIHKDHCGNDDEGWIFAKPMLPIKPPAKKQTKAMVPAEEIEATPGKNWRRSISIARNTTCPKPENALSTFKKPRASFIIVPSTLRRETTLSLQGISEDVVELAEESLEKPSVTVANDHDQSLKRISKALLEASILAVDDVEESGQEKSVDFLEKLLGFCSLKRVVGIYQVFSSKVLSSSTKVGEGAFGEVFLINSQDTEKPVLKVVPIGGNLEVNGEEQTSFEDICSEVMISSFLSQLRNGSRNRTSGFVELRSCNVFEGKYPGELLKLWDKFDQERESENDRPDFFPKTQKFIALEFGNGGKDLEKYVFNHPTQALAAWRQVVHTLAVAEQQLNFEHRDLHWGNILIKDTKEKVVEFWLDGDVFEVATEGVLTNIIDFSLSRLTTEGVTIFSDKTQDPTLFTAKGKDKPGGDYQFDIYRMMRGHNKENWEVFSPKTNIFWLHYMLDKMIDGVYYSKSCKKTTKVYKQGMKSLRDLKDSLLSDYDSATEFVRRNGTRVEN